MSLYYMNKSSITDHGHKCVKYAANSWQLITGFVIIDPLAMSGTGDGEVN